MKKIFYLIFISIFFFSPIAHAEIKNYSGFGEYLMSEFETLDVAKNQAKLTAVRNIAEKIFVKVQSSTEIKNSELIHDEIILESENFLHIIDVKYKIWQEGEEILVKAFVTVEVDSEEIENIVKKFKEA